MDHTYPDRETHKVGGFTYASDMARLAVARDDADGFMRFIEECGGVNCDVLISASVINYAASYGAKECVKKVFYAGGGKDEPLDYWLEKASKPWFGAKSEIIRP